ncbi:dockerin type I domain-containing protein [bacterium]|nr:dockerin type I domain-containing protein [bacterium]MDB4775621.1 dockerin type I domain-containing protein [bacterium]
MKVISVLPATAAACIAVTATADITGVYTTRYIDTSEDRGQSTQTTTVIDVYVSSDDDADTVLGVFDFSLAPEAQVVFFQSATEALFPTNTWWLPKNPGGIFDIESVRRSDSFVTIGGVEQNVLRPEQSPGVGDGQRIDDDFADPFDIFFAAPQPNSGGWWNSTPENLAGQVGPVALAGPNGEPSGFGRGVFVGRFSYYGDDFSIEDTTLTVAWNQGPGTPQQEADFTIPPVVTPVECVGDITGDGNVDSSDLGILIALWNTSAKSNPEADLNRDGTVNAADIGLLIGAWGPCP